MKIISWEWDDEARAVDQDGLSASRGSREIGQTRHHHVRGLTILLVLSLFVGLLSVSKQSPTISLHRGPYGNIELAGNSGQMPTYTAGEFWGGGSEMENCSVCSPSGLLGKSGGRSTEPGQPVDPMTGGYTYNKKLFSVGAAAGNLSMNLTYDSGLAAGEQEVGAAPGYFGFGWTSTMSSSVIFTNGTLIVNDENTAQTRFNQASNDQCPLGDYQDFQKYTVVNSSYAFCAANRVDAQAGVALAYGLYLVYQSGGKTFQIYDALGQLTWNSTNDAMGGINLKYNVTPGTGGCPTDGESSCFFEIDTSDNNGARQVVAEVDGYGLVQEVVDPFGYEYQMDYTDGQGNLNEVLAPSPAGGLNSTIFTYSGAPTPYGHELATVTDPDSNKTTIGYYSYGMVNTVQDPYTNTNTYSYEYTDCATLFATQCMNQQTTSVVYADGEQDQDSYTDGLLYTDLWGQSYNGGTNTEGWGFSYAEPTASNQDAPIVETVDPPTQINNIFPTITTDSSGNVLSFKDPAGNVTTNMYNDTGGNNLDELCWSAAPGVKIPSNPTCSYPPAGATVYNYDSLGHKLSETDPLGNTTRYGYFADGLLCWTAQPTVTAAGSPCSGNGTSGGGSAIPSGATSYVYDAQGDETAKIVSASPSPAQVTTSEYNVDDQVEYTIPPNGFWQGNYGSNPYETAYTWEANGEMQSQVGPMNRATTYTYDAAGNQLTKSDPAGVTTTAYDLNNRPCWSLRASTAYPNTVCSSMPSGATRYPLGYLNDTNAPIVVEDPNGQLTNYSYSDHRFPTKATLVVEPAVPGNPQLNIDTYSSYDNYENVCVTGPVNPGAAGTCAQPAGNGDTVDQYNSEGQLTSSTNPDNQQTTYGYTNAAFPTNATSSNNPLNKTTNYIYDADGRLVLTQDPAGNYVTTNYDADGNLCYRSPTIAFNSCASPPTGTGVSVYGYDQANQRISMKDNYNNGGTGQINDAYSYDSDGNLLSASNDNGQTNTYAYDYAVDLTCISYVAIANSTCSGTPSGSYVNRGYNGAGQLATTTDWLGNTVAYSNYNALGEVQTISYPTNTGESLTYGYDADGNVTGLSYGGTKISGLSGSDSWTPNADRQVGASSNIHSFSSPADTYDQYGRVQKATNPTSAGSQSGPDTYLYNNDGDLTSDTPPTGSQITNSYNNGDQLTSVTNPNNPASTEYGSFQYTADGQRCWSNWASSVTTQACGSAPSGATQYAWNNYGQLCFSGSVSGAASCSSGGATSYTYDGNNLRMSLTAGSGTTKYDWDTVGGGKIPLDISDGTNSYIYGPLLFGGTAPIEQISSSGSASFITSTQQGVQALFTGGSSPTLSELAAYSIWGIQVIQSGIKATPFGYQGSYTDASGLIYLINRFYDPNTDQFLSIDPNVEETGQPYTYTGDDPLNATDPLGLKRKVHRHHPVPRSVINSLAAFSAAAAVTHARGGRPDYPQASLHETVKKYVPWDTMEQPDTVGRNGNKIIFYSDEHAVQVVYDKPANYFRVYNSKNDTYLTEGGKWLTNKNMSSAELNTSHFSNSDPPLSDSEAVSIYSEGWSSVEGRSGFWGSIWDAWTGGGGLGDAGDEG